MIIIIIMMIMIIMIKIIIKISIAHTMTFSITAVPVLHITSFQTHLKKSTYMKSI